jgi:hypothetical protein
VGSQNHAFGECPFHDGIDRCSVGHAQPNGPFGGSRVLGLYGQKGGDNIGRGGAGVRDDPLGPEALSDEHRRTVG